MPTATTVRVTGLGKRQMSKLASRAKRLGLTTSGYVKRLVEADLELGDLVQKSPLIDLFGPPQEVDEEELDRLVDQARTRHHNKVTKGR